MKVVKFAIDMTRRFPVAQTLCVAVQGLTENVAGRQLVRQACDMDGIACQTNILWL